jgi:hypothetical protein
MQSKNDPIYILKLILYPKSYKLHSFNQQYIFVLTYLFKYFANVFSDTGLPESFTLAFYLFILFFHTWLPLLLKMLLLAFKSGWISGYLLLIVWSVSINLRTLIIWSIIIEPYGFAFFTLKTELYVSGILATFLSQCLLVRVLLS